MLQNATTSLKINMLMHAVKFANTKFVRANFLFIVVAIFARHAMCPINLCKLEAGLVVLIKNMLFLSCRVDKNVIHVYMLCTYIHILYWVG